MYKLKDVYLAIYACFFTMEDTSIEDMNQVFGAVLDDSNEEELS